MSIEDALNVIKTESCYECSFGCDSAYQCNNAGCPLREAVHVAVEALERVEPKRGKWKPIDLTWGRSFYYCTACEITENVPTSMGEPYFNYCPNCGARMDGGEE